MTPFRNDDTNPYSRPSVWPKMPQTPMRVGPLPRAAPRAPALTIAEVEVTAAAAEAEMAIPEPAPEPPPEPQPIAAPIGIRPSGRKQPSRREPRLTPLIAAAAVGAGGMAALFLLIGMRPTATPPAATAEPRSTLAVGEMVGETAPAAPEAPPAASVAALAPTLRLAAAPLVRRQPAAEPAATPTPVAIATFGGPAELLATPPPTAAPFVPSPPPDRNAPIATHAPD
jgi:hypothetical protein